MSSENTIMGFIPKDKYVKITYILILVSCGLGLLTSLFGLLGIGLPLGGIVNLTGLLGLVMALLGLFVFKNEFPSLDQSHLLYLAILFAIFFVATIILAAALTIVPVLLYLVLIAVTIVQTILFFTGYNSWSHGRSVTKNNVKAEMQLAFKRA